MIEIWTEKYRPTSLGEFIASDKDELEKLINPVKLPHLLLVSKTPGTGKTSLAKIIINKLGADALILNSSDDRKIEVVREKVNQFASSLSSKPNVPRIIFMDEFDGMTGIAQDALRNVMETYYSNCRFILTANNLNKIIEPLQSRCFRVDLKMPEKADIVNRLKYIAKQEAVKAESDEVFTKIADIHYPNIRDSIKMLQQLSIKGEIALNDVKPELHTEGKIYEMLKGGECEGARKLWLDRGLNAEDLLLNIYKLALRDTGLKNDIKKKVVLASAKYNYQIGFGDPEIQLYAFTLQLSDIVRGVV